MHVPHLTHQLCSVSAWHCAERKGERKREREREVAMDNVSKQDEMNTPCFLDPHTVLRDVEIVENIVWLQ